MSAIAHRFDSRNGAHVLLADGSRIYDLSPEIGARLDEALAVGGQPLQRLLHELGLDGQPHVDDRPLQDPPLRALSLAVAQKCNLGCSYCYAQGGAFGAAPKSMTWSVARDSVLRLLEQAVPGETVSLAFLGGEPLVNRDLIRRTAQFARAEAKARQVAVRFSITTNGTLLEAHDAEFFEEHGFAVTLSLDGVGATHDRLRPFRGGAGSYERIVQRARPLLALQQQMQVAARVTVTPLNLGLHDTLDGLLSLGFHSVGFAPMLKAPSGALELQAGDLDAMLAEMIRCGRRFTAETIAGRRYAFSNMSEALRQIHRGTHRPYPCGAGAGYFGVSAEGGLYACHRFVEDEARKLGDVRTGVDRTRRKIWLAERHVHKQHPCGGCWARYLCGGGCHHEVIHRGRQACDFIRGWLHYCLGAYVEVMEGRPDYFSGKAAPSA